MSLPAWHETAISRKYNSEAFDCGEPALNTYLQKHARKNHESGGAKTFLAIADHDSAILGYYSLSPASLECSRVPESVWRGLGHYDVPGFRLARLAVSLGVQKQGLGGQLLLSAGQRSLLAATEVGGIVLIIDAKNQAVAEWYSTYRAMALLDAPLSLVLPLATIGAALKSAGRI